jgi:hypothetical protein
MAFNEIQMLVFMFCALVLTALPLIKDRRKASNQKFSFLSANIFFWGLAVYLTRNATSPENAVFWASILPLGVRLVAPAFLDFCLDMVNNNTTRWRRIKYVSYASGITFYILGFSPYFYKGAVRYSFGYITQSGVLHSVWLVSGLIISAAACYVLAGSYLQANNLIRHKLKYLCFASAIFLLSSVANSLPMHGIEFYPFGTLGGILGLMILGYSAVENRLVDINVLVSETVLLVMAQSVLVAAFIYLVIALNIDNKSYLLLLVCAALPGLLFFSAYLSGRFRNILVRQLEKIFPEAYSFRKRLSNSLEFLMEEYEDFEENITGVFESPDIRIVPADDPAMAGLQKSYFGTTPHKNRLLALDDLKSGDIVRSALLKENIYMVVPLQLFSLEKPKLLGYLLLDLSLREKIFRKEDFDLIKTLSSSLALLWFASKSFQKLRRENEALSRSLHMQLEDTRLISPKYNH